jgi:hypothetical protein
MEKAIETFNKVIDLAPEGTIETMLARINKSMLKDICGMPERAEEAISMAILMHPDNMKQLILDGGHLYELKDKENLTFDDMNILEAKEWTQEEERYRLGVHLLETGHLNSAVRVLRYTREFARDTSDIDACIAYALWKSGQAEMIGNAVENALEGKSWMLFKLFGIPYRSNMSKDAFLEILKNTQN